MMNIRPMIMVPSYTYTEYNQNLKQQTGETPLSKV